MSAIQSTILALPAPGNPLARYVAIREAQLANPHLALTQEWGVLRGFSFPAWPELVAYEKQHAKHLYQERLRERSRVRRMAKRHQAKWPPLAGTQKFAELISWKLDRSLPDAETSVLVCTWNSEIGEGFYDGENWRWAAGHIIPSIQFASWADLPSGPILGRRVN